MTKKKIILTVIVVILIALIAFCLIYTRPQPLSSLLNDREITSISALVVEAKVSNGKPYHDNWELQGDLVTDQSLNDLISLMENSPYRLSLRTLTNPRPSSYELDSSTPTVYIGVLLEDGTYVSITYSGSGVHISGDMYIIASTSKSVCKSLAVYVMENGTRT